MGWTKPREESYKAKLLQMVFYFFPKMKKSGYNPKVQPWTRMAKFVLKTRDSTYISKIHGQKEMEKYSDQQ